MGAVNIMRMFYILSCVYLLLNACEKKYQTELQTIPTSGVITLKSEGDNNQSIGFSFSTASIVSIPNHHDVIPDFMLLVQLSSQSEVIGVFFSAPVIRSAFYLISQVSTADSAVAIFDNLTEVPDITYQDLALPVEAHQIWAVRTQENKFAKIRIISTRAFDRNAGSLPMDPYGEATFEWVYQPDGSRTF